MVYELNKVNNVDNTISIGMQGLHNSDDTVIISPTNQDNTNLISIEENLSATLFLGKFHQ